MREIESKAGEVYRSGMEGSEEQAREAELSREPNVHLGPERYRTIRGGASETV